MRFKIKDIPDAGRDVDADLDGAQLKDALEGTGADLARSSAHVQLHVSRVGDNVFARGRITGTAMIPCSRCLTPAELAVDVPLQVTFTPEDEAPPDDDVMDDVELATHDRQYVVLDEILREALILALPMSPLCRPECKGLCPVCGQDKNVADCGCDPHPSDPRFAALKNLKV